MLGLFCVLGHNEMHLNPFLNAGNGRLVNRCQPILYIEEVTLFLGSRNLNSRFFKINVLVFGIAIRWEPCSYFIVSVLACHLVGIQTNKIAPSLNCHLHQFKPHSRVDGFHLCRLIAVGGVLKLLAEELVYISSAGNVPLVIEVLQRFKAFQR